MKSKRYTNKQHNLLSEDEKKQAWERAKDKANELYKGWDAFNYQRNEKYKKWMWQGDIDSYEFDYLTNEEIDIIHYDYHGNYDLYKRDIKMDRDW